MSADRQWKGEGGFKNGYLSHLEVMLNTKFPGCGLKAIPHIESKFKWFKDKYAVVSEMVNKTSGFQWDDQTKMIQCEKQAYDDFCKVNKFVRTLLVIYNLYSSTNVPILIRIILKLEGCGGLHFLILIS